MSPDFLKMVSIDGFTEVYGDEILPILRQNYLFWMGLWIS